MGNIKNHKIPQPGILWRAPEVAKFLNISNDQAAKLLQDGQLRKIDHNVLVRGADLERNKLYTNKYEVLEWLARKFNTPRPQEFIEFYKDVDIIDVSTFLPNT